MKRIAAAAILTLATAGAAQAHHSFAMFDMTKEVMLDGVIKEFRWTNPHSWIVITVKDASGVEKDWYLEGVGPGALVRAGWKRSDIKVGDRAVVKAHPLRDGSTGGSVESVSINGRVLGGQAGGN